MTEFFFGQRMPSTERVFFFFFALIPKKPLKTKKKIMHVYLIRVDKQVG